MIEGVKSKSFVQLDVSQSQSLQARRTMRQQKMVSPLVASNSQSQSFSRKIQDLNLADKLKNLQESISHLPNKVHRTRSNASKKGRNTFHNRGDNSIASIDFA